MEEAIDLRADDLAPWALPRPGGSRPRPRSPCKTRTVSDEISYARTDDTHVAYRQVSDGDAVDLVAVSGMFFPMEVLAEDRVAARFTEGLAALGRLVVFDKRGIGLSDPFTDWSRPAVEQWADDVIAVIEASGLERPIVVSWDLFGPARRATARPDRGAGPHQSRSRHHRAHRPDRRTVRYPS